MTDIDELAARKLQAEARRMGDRVRITIGGVTLEAEYIDSPVPPEPTLFDVMTENQALRSEVERLRAALVEERARGNLGQMYADAEGMHGWGDLVAQWPPLCEEYRESARAELRAEGLLPPE